MQSSVLGPEEAFPPTLDAARARIAAVQPTDYARSRNALNGAVSRLSPYITHGVVCMADVLAGVNARHPLDVQHKFVFELGWRAYFRHIWQHRGAEILQSLHGGPLPEACYASRLPNDIRHAATGVPVIDKAVRTLYATGYLHNHARMWLASYVVHLRKVHWRVGADWLYSHLLDGDLASNHLSWQWVAGTSSHKPYLFNADNVARFAPPAWHSPGSVIDLSYEALDQLARQPHGVGQGANFAPHTALERLEPPVSGTLPAEWGWTAPDGRAVAGRDVWLVHPWNLGALPASLPAGTVVVGLFLENFHQAWPWSGRRWEFVATRMADMVALRWQGDAAAIAAALQGARSVGSIDEPHMSPWLPSLARCEAYPALFPSVDTRCDAFSQWWKRAVKGFDLAADLLAASLAPARA
ncbi:MAG: deoxyribodipyrimidine photolyase [Betaproteobacteria bacterium]|nr:deoxyribodipyrimidine photolyase [Betaproteobacteria bacterium]